TSEAELFWLVRTLTGLAWYSMDISKLASAQRYARYATNLAPQVLCRWQTEQGDAWHFANARSLWGGGAVASAATDVAADAKARIFELQKAQPLLLEGCDGLEQSTAIPAARRSTFLREAMERLVRLHELWDTLVPGTGHAAQA